MDNGAYEMAGIKDPLKELDVAEICEPYAFQELLWYEGLGFCGEGEGAKLLDDGVTEMGGELPVNPSGGAFSPRTRSAHGEPSGRLRLRSSSGARRARDRSPTPKRPWCTAYTDSEDSCM